MIKENMPLVTIGIPTYNRCELLERSITSALSQDYPLIEVIISDNASTDSTEQLCQRYCEKDKRIKYVKQLSNIGPGENFSQVLFLASGKYFMWLGDDDWLDPAYLSGCISVLEENKDISLVSGRPLYYRNGKKSHQGKMFDLQDEDWARRVFRYYHNVTDNGIFYGVMRTKKLQTVSVKNSMGSDWHLIANIVAMGKSKMLYSVAVHRELGGATASYKDIVKSLGLPSIQAVFPMTTISIGAWKNILFSGQAYKMKSKVTRILLAKIILILIPSRNIKGYLGWIKSSLFKH